MSDTGGADMSFWGHLGALRTVILKILAVFVVLAGVFFYFMPWIFEHVITAPCSGDFITYRLLGFVKGDGQLIADFSSNDFHVELINIKLATQFFVHMSASCWAAFIVAFPIIIYLLWTFVSPGLYPNERQGARKAFLFGNVMFYIGMAVGYFVVFPMALRFLADYHLSDKIANTVSLDSYMDNFWLMVMMMGLFFEIPVVCWMLGKMGLLKRSFFGRYRKYAFASLLVLSAIVTPTSDLFTLTIVFVPIYALWELSALLVPSGKDKSADDKKNNQN